MVRVAFIAVCLLAGAHGLSGGGGLRELDVDCEGSDCDQDVEEEEQAGSCCPQGSWPYLEEPADYIPKGTESMIGDALPIYFVGEPGARAVIVFPEVWGWKGRLKAIADTLAESGFFVVMPDCHRGETKDDFASIGEFMAKYPYETVIGPDIEAVVAWLKGEQQATSIGAIGFCWGGWALSKASAMGVDLKCGVSPHPSVILEQLAFNRDMAEMMRNVKMPLLLMPSKGEDPTLQPGGEVAMVITANGGAVEAFPGMDHGWVTRGDLSVPEVKVDVEKAIGRAIEFFKEKLGEP